MGGNTRAETIERYKALLDSGAISQEEYDVLKQEVVSDAATSIEQNGEKASDEPTGTVEELGGSGKAKAKRTNKPDQAQGKSADSKIALIAVLLILASLLTVIYVFASQPKYKGNVAGAVAYCQGAGSGNHLVEVTGYVRLVYGENSEYIRMSDGPYSDSPTVSAKLQGKGSSAIMGSYITIRGHADGTLATITDIDSSIRIWDAEVV